MPDESRVASPQRHVFVYGTLRRGGSNDITRLTLAPRFIGMARVPGRLYTLGRYPGMRLGGAQEAGARVLGEVYAITPQLEAVLDRIEGLVPGAPAHADDEYARREVLVRVQGQELCCLVYEIHVRHAIESARLPHGDWLHGAGL